MRHLLTPALAVLLSISSSACQIETENPKPAPPATAELKPAVKLERQNLTVEARHSETTKIGDLAELMVSIQNKSTTPVSGVRIRVSNGYFEGLEVRRAQPDVLEVTTINGSKVFAFPGVKAESKFAYLFVLNPLREGDFAAEMEVSIVDADDREDFLAIYDLTTRVEPLGTVEEQRP